MDYDEKREITKDLTVDQEEHIYLMLKTLRKDLEEVVKGLGIVQEKLNEYLK